MNEKVGLPAPFDLSDEELAQLSIYLRQKVFEICREARSGHIGGSSGAVELFATLYFGGILRYAPDDARHVARDRVLVRGHVGPIRYPIFSLLGWVAEEELWTYRMYGSRLHGHEDHQKTPGVDLTPSGSLGMLLSYGVGCAVSALQTVSPHVTYVFIGDGEEEEGNVSEAARHAAHLNLRNLIAIIDRNGKQLSDPVSETDSASLETVWRGYGWNVVPLKEGHDHAEIRRAFREALALSATTQRPSVIVADTVKGFGLEGAEAHFSGYHTTSTCSKDIVERGIQDLARRCETNSSQLAEIKVRLGRMREEKVQADSPLEEAFVPRKLEIGLKPDTPNHPDACQGYYFQRLGEERRSGGLQGQRLYFLTADVTRYDQVQMLGLRDFCHYYNVGIREQHAIGFAHGLSLTDPSARIIINSFDAFMYRWMDQVNAAAQGGSSMLIIADTAGLTNAQNGRTHQSSGQPGAVLTMPGVVFLEPWDAEDTYACLNWAIGESRGVVYLRVHSSSISIAPHPQTQRNLTSYVMWEPSSDPDITVIASGMTVSAALEAAQRLETEGIGVRVVNLVNHKAPGALLEAIVPNKPLLTVYNGAAEVLLGNVSKRILESRTAPRPSFVAGLGFDFGTTGRVEDLKAHYGLDADGVTAAIRRLVG